MDLEFTRRDWSRRLEKLQAGAVSRQRRLKPPSMPLIAAVRATAVLEIIDYDPEPAAGPSGFSHKRPRSSQLGRPRCGRRVMR